MEEKMRHWQRFALLLALALLLAACGSDGDTTGGDAPAAGGGMVMPLSPDGLDLSTEKMTEGGHFKASVASELDPLVLNQIHNWILHLETPDGQPVEGATLAVDGGMPQHLHGFPTAPEVTQDLGGGDYLIEGIRFSMSGWWTLTLDVEAAGQTDTVTFNIVLP
jgi:hypothetical protein